MPRTARRARVLVVLCAALAGAACTSTPTPSRGASPSPSGGGSSSPALTATVTALPDGCTKGAPPATATVAFVASGRAWAVAPDGTNLTCLFATTDPGPFRWGPRADRVAVGGLQVVGVGSSVNGPSLARAPGTLAWGRPTGLSLVFPNADGTQLDKVLVGSHTVSAITPIPDRTYSDVVYHGSGLAIAFVTSGRDGSEVDLSSNTGADAQRLVFSQAGTTFGPLAFDATGTGLLYAAKLANGTRMLADYGLKPGTADEGLWVGTADVLAVVPDARNPGHVALTVGSGCADAKAIVSILDGTAGTTALPDAKDPTQALGWLDEHTLLVAEGGCGPVALWAVDTSRATGPTLVVRDVDRGAARVADPTPPPKLPAIGVSSGFA